MPTVPVPAPLPRWRIDGVATALAGVGIALVLAVFTGPNWFGPWGDDVAAALVDSLGLGLGVLLAGWFALVGLYIARRSWPRLGVRALGWIALTLSASGLADKALNLNLSLFGPGGSVGAGNTGRAGAL